MLHNLVSDHIHIRTWGGDILFRSSDSASYITSFSVFQEGRPNPILFPHKVFHLACALHMVVKQGRLGTALFFTSELLALFGQRLRNAAVKVEIKPRLL